MLNLIIWIVIGLILATIATRLNTSFWSPRQNYWINCVSDWRDKRERYRYYGDASYNARIRNICKTGEENALFAYNNTKLALIFMPAFSYPAAIIIPVFYYLNGII